MRRDLMMNTSDTNFLNKLRKQFRLIFISSLKDLESENYTTPIFRDHIEYIDDENYSTYFIPYKKQNKLTLIVRDYIAGMSDNYFNNIYHYYQNYQ